MELRRVGGHGVISKGLKSFGGGVCGKENKPERFRTGLENALAGCCKKKWTLG